MTLDSLQLESEASPAALRFQRNVVVAASAGTGKTHRLTALYVMLTLGLTSMGCDHFSEAHPPIAPDRVVATTFSRAAAREIRARIERALQTIAGRVPGASPFAAEIARRRAELAELISDEELAARAQNALALLPEARIETLHGLAGDLLRRNALALGLSPDLRVLDEDESEALAFGVIDEVLSSALEGNEEEREGSRALADVCGGLFRAREALGPFFDRLDEDGLDVSALGTSDYLGVAIRLRAELISAVRSCTATSRPALKGAVMKALSALADSGEGPEISAAAEVALEELFTLRQPSKLESYEQPLFALRKDLSGATNAAKAATLLATLREARSTEGRERSMLALLARIRARLTEERLARGVVGFGDLLRLARDGLRDRPLVAALARDDIDALLVDEFQDTSPVQRDLVYLLRQARRTAPARPAGKIPSARDIERHGLFLVGDRKQSIYGFRGADVTVFNRVCGELTGEAAARELELPRAMCATEPLAELVVSRMSHRSKPAIVDFVNAFSVADFAGLAAGGLAYGPGEHLTTLPIAANDVAGRVVFVRDQGEPLEVDEPLLVSAGPALREAFVAASAAHRLLGDPDAQLSPRDIAILARRRATIPLIELALSRLGLPYVVAGRALYDTLEIRDLAALLRLVLEPSDRRALAHVLRGPLVALSESGLLSLFRDEEGRPVPFDLHTSALDRTAFPEEAARLEAFRRRFAEVRPTLLRLRAPEALRRAMQWFDLDRITAALPRAAPRLGNLDRLVHIAQERGGSLFSFSRWVERRIADETDEPEAVVFSADDDAIRLLTIHGSKGLDFPATIVVDLGVREHAAHPAIRFVTMPGETEARVVAYHRGDRGSIVENPARKHANQLATTHSAAERARITYVALTRARRVLCLIGSARPPRSGTMLGTLSARLETELGDHVEIEEANAVLLDALAAAGPARGPHRPPVELTRTEPIHIASRDLAEAVSIATTPFGVFRGCARRFWFRFLLGLEEPVDTGQLDLFEVDPEMHEKKVAAFEPGEDDPDPRAVGRAAHRILETLDLARLGSEPIRDEELVAPLVAEGVAPTSAEELARNLGAFLRGAYSKELVNADEVHREAEVALELAEAPRLCLRGTVDLWMRTADRIDVVDYKLSASGSLDPYAFQLRAYALALARMFPAARVRTGIVFLRGASEPVWLTSALGGDTLAPVDHDTFERDLSATTLAFAEARAADRWPGVEVGQCRRERCGFITACHRTTPSGPKPRRLRRSSRA